MIQARQELAHLVRTGKTRFIDHIQVTGGAGPPLTAMSKKGLQGFGRDTRLAKLMRRAGRGSEALDLITSLLRSFPDGK